MDIRATNPVGFNPYQSPRPAPETQNLKSAADTSRAANRANGSPGAQQVEGFTPSVSRPPEGQRPEPAATETRSPAQEARTAQRNQEPTPQATAAQVAYQFQTQADPNTRAAERQNEQAQARQQASINLLA